MLGYREQTWRIGVYEDCRNTSLQEGGWGAPSILPRDSSPDSNIRFRTGTLLMYTNKTPDRMT